MTLQTVLRAANALELHDVEKKFKKKRNEYSYALKGVSLTVKRGEVVGILGPNGSGKSTLVRVMSTLTLPDAGEVRVFDIDAVKQPREVQRYINRVSVEASFFKKMSSQENLIFGAKLYGVSDRESKPRIQEILESIGFDIKRIGEPMEHLSRGMQQKIALARALLTSPMLMLLDEPTTGLDPRSKKDVQRLIQSIRTSHDSSILLCTHDMEEAEQLCDRIGILLNGKLIALDTPDGLKRQYQQDGQLPSLEEVFMAATGTSLEDAEFAEELADDKAETAKVA
ncbi:MAG TPA: ABC transporter ATP-binding protein [Thermomicrobiales bacterium]|jgi:ABC-2 type transport system ATP-binding protein|nr:ABC transporter ATP-binding protein [Thermomicrobiales bacterium]